MRPHGPLPLLALAFAALGCPPAPVAPPPDAADAGDAGGLLDAPSPATPCERACARWAALGCVKESRPNCVAECLNDITAGLTSPKMLSCVVNAADRPSVQACGLRMCRP
jgi:hypothetical protein